MKFNLWKFTNMPNNTGGWVFVAVVYAPTEELALSGAAQKLKIKKMWLRVYPHIDSMPAVPS